MSVKRYLLKGSEIRSLSEFYDELARRLPLPGHFGRNLDALWDVLSTDIAGPFRIIWEEAPVSEKAMGADFLRIVALFEDLKKEREDFDFVLK